MSKVPLFGPYPSERSFVDAWHSLALRRGARSSIAGRSVEGRDLLRFEFGAHDGVPVLLTALMHGIEVIGSVALHRAIERIFESNAQVLEHVRLVVLPIVNPDAYAENMRRLHRGAFAWQRGNARGVDLNRNFPQVAPRTTRHPFAGSSNPWSPHYLGPHPLSEPESAAVAAVAREIEPRLALGFHSFGDMLLYPWAHTRAKNPRHETYAAFGEAFRAALVGRPYHIGQATQLYPTIGDLDDHLDVAHDTLAFTIEVGTLDRRLLHPARTLNPFCWMNPTSAETIASATDRLAPAIAALLGRLAPVEVQPAVAMKAASLGEASRERLDTRVHLGRR